MKTFVRVALLGASLLASTSGLLVAGALADPQKGGNLVYDEVSGPGTLDPYVSSSAVELEVIHHIFEPLVDHRRALRDRADACVQDRYQSRRQDLHLQAA